MSVVELAWFPKPKVDGTGHVQYRCEECGDLMEPDEAVIEGGKSYHPDHLPGEHDGR